MRRSLLLLPILLLSVFAFADTPTKATPKVPTVQDNPTEQNDDQAIPDLPPAQRQEAAKPFLGTFDGISCEETMIGLRFRISQATATDMPTARLLASSDGETIDLAPKNDDWKTVGFFSQTDKDGNDRVYLIFTNYHVFVAVTAYNGRLAGVSVTPPEQTKYSIDFAPASLDLDEFVRANRNICTSTAAQKKFLEKPAKSK